MIGTLQFFQNLFEEVNGRVGMFLCFYTYEKYESTSLHPVCGYV